LRANLNSTKTKIITPAKFRDSDFLEKIWLIRIPKKKKNPHEKIKWGWTNKYKPAKQNKNKKAVNIVEARKSPTIKIKKK
jgi:hypothetical protein